MVRRLLSLVSFVMVFCDGYKLHNCTSEDVKYTLYFLGFFPCSPDSTRDLNECDMLTLSAVELAIDKINHDPNILSCFELELLPVFVNKDIVETFSIIKQIYDNYPIHGVIGPYDGNFIKPIVHIFGGYLNTLQISYSVTDPSLEDTSRYPYFYATVPTDYFVNKMRRQVLRHFGWKKVAILSSYNENSVLIAEHLSNLLRTNESETVHFLGSFTTSPGPLLEEAKDLDIRIFLPIIEEMEARRLFCIAYHLKLTTADHVWILPGIYNTKWWYLEDNDTTSNCTNEQILEAINSTLFVDTSPFNINMKTKVDDVLTEIFYNVVLNISANMTMEEYSSLIIHSKLLNAYDATIALALTWNASLSKIENDFLNDDIFSVIDNPQYYPLLGEILQESLENLDSPYNGLGGQYMLDHSFSRNEYGFGLLTQWIGIEECGLGRFTTNGSGDINISFSHYSIGNTIHNCNVSWKDGYQPTDRDEVYICTFISTSYVTFLIISTVLFFVIIVISLCLLPVTYYMRNNKHFKASSVKFNIVLNLVCCCLCVVGLIVVTVSYLGKKEYYTDIIPSLCEMFLWLLEISLTVLFATFVVKTWRIYYIFHNPNLKERKYLSDWILLIWVVVLLFPTIVVLVTQTLIDQYILITIKLPFECPNIQVSNSTKTYIEEKSCTLMYSLYWFTAADIYRLLLFISLLLMTCHNSKILTYFRKEEEIASLIMGFILFVLSLVSTSILLINSSSTITITVVVINVITVIFLLAVLYLPKFVAVLIDKRQTKHEDQLLSKERHNILTDKYQEIEQLKSTLKKIEAAVSYEITKESILLKIDNFHESSV